MSVWKTLSAIDCEEHTDKKGKFSYLAWTWAWAMVKEKYPEATYALLPDTTFPDGTMEVRVQVTIQCLEHDMWLPVLDFNNKAIQNPNAYDINTSRMRCLVKCLAMFGLGHYIYAGESAPQIPDFTQAQKDEFIGLMAEKDAWGLKRFTQVTGEHVMNALFNDAPKGKVTAQKDAARALIKEANDHLKRILAAIQEALEDGSSSALEEIYMELTPTQNGYVEAALNEIQKHQVKTMMENAA